MKDWWQFKQPGSLARVLFVLGFLAVQLGPIFGAPNSRVIGAVGAGIALAAAIASLTEQRAWYAVLCAALVYAGFTAQPRSWATLSTGGRISSALLLMLIGFILVLVVLQALGIVKPHASHKESQASSG